MTEQSVRVNKVSWADLCPWTVIFRSLSSATSMTVLILAFLGLMAMPAGWWVSEMLFVDANLQSDRQLSEVIQHNRNPHSRVFLATNDEANSVNILGARLSGPRMVFTQLVQPFARLFSMPSGVMLNSDGNLIQSRFSVRAFLYLLIGCVFSIFIWSFVGVAICRVCLLKLTRNEPVNLDEAIEFAVSKYFAAAGAIGIPLIGVFAMCVPTFLFGILMGLDIGVFLVGVFWFAVLAISVAMALLLLGLMFGWPLMVASVACESQNNFDAMTRAYAYTFQRPVNYGIYMLIAMAFGGVCWFVVANLSDGVVGLSYWSTSFGTHLVSGDVDRMDVIRGIAANSVTNAEGNIATEDPSTLLTGGQGMIRGWTWLAKSVAASFVYGLFWCMTSAIYLLLRHDVDDTEMDEVSIDHQHRTYELPPLKTDENGIPQVQKPIPAEGQSDQSENNTNDRTGVDGSQPPSDDTGQGQGQGEADPDSTQHDGR